LLLPGFLASRLKQRLTVIREQSELDKIVEALLYSFVIYIIYSFFVRSFPVTLTIETKGQSQEYSLKKRSTPASNSDSDCDWPWRSYVIRRKSRYLGPLFSPHKGKQSLLARHNLE